MALLKMEIKRMQEALRQAPQPATHSGGRPSSLPHHYRGGPPNLSPQDRLGPAIEDGRDGGTYAYRQRTPSPSRRSHSRGRHRSRGDSPSVCSSYSTGRFEHSHGSPSVGTVRNDAPTADGTNRAVVIYDDRTANPRNPNQNPKTVPEHKSRAHNTHEPPPTYPPKSDNPPPKANVVVQHDDQTGKRSVYRSDTHARHTHTHKHHGGDHRHQPYTPRENPPPLIRPYTGPYGRPPRSNEYRMKQLTISPFTPEIDNEPTPPGFHLPKFTKFDRVFTEAYTHLVHFRNVIRIYTSSDALMCKAFSSSLGDLGLMWFNCLLLAPSPISRRLRRNS